MLCSARRSLGGLLDPQPTNGGRGMKVRLFLVAKAQEFKKSDIKLKLATHTTGDTHSGSPPKADDAVAD